MNQIAGRLEQVSLAGLSVEPDAQLPGRAVAADLQVEGEDRRQNKERNAPGREQVAENPVRERDIGEMGDGIGGSQLPA